jgi:hypothetical protein
MFGQQMMNPMMFGGGQVGFGGQGFGMPGMGQPPMMMMMMMMLQMMQQMMGQMMGGAGGGCGCGMGPGMGGDPFGGFGNQMGGGFGFPGGGFPGGGFPGGGFPGGFSPPGVPFGGGYCPPAPNYGNPGYGGAGFNPMGPMAGPGNFGGPSAFGNRLAADANQIARSGVAGSGGNCKRGVRMALNRQGVNLDGLSAYQGADQLARNPRFREVQVDRNALRGLPPGAIVVWNRKPGHPHGHISIALGNGREASDVIRNQITGYGSAFRVFLPK